jgi:hypothetical protein
MNRIWNRYSAAVLFAILVVGGLALMNRTSSIAQADKADKAISSGARYTVVETEGHNLLVTDNSTNIFYFYTVDKGEPVGSELKLRGTVDLNEVGKPTIKPKAINIQK